MPEALCLNFPPYLKAPLINCFIMFTLLAGLPLSHRMVLIFVYERCGLTYVVMALFIHCTLLHVNLTITSYLPLGCERLAYNLAIN